MFGEMVFYLEACESGSMFPSLTSDQNVYAVTASNATQSSYAAYCGRPYDVVDGVSIGSCLGDEFSVNWMEDSDSANPFLETLDEQFEIVKSKTLGSPVQKFGDFDFVNEPIGNFEGSNILQPSFIQYSLDLIESMKLKKLKSTFADKGLVDSRDVNAFVLLQRVEESGDKESFFELEQELKHRENENFVFASVFADQEGIELIAQPTKFDCLRSMIRVHDETCGRFSDYSLKFVKHLVHTCETESEEGIADASKSLADTCL